MSKARNTALTRVPSAFSKLDEAPPLPSTTLTLARLRQVQLPDLGQWTNRFEIKSESSNRLYVVSQHGDKRGCSCPGWRTGRKCKHLAALGLPAHEKPFELQA